MRCPHIGCRGRTHVVKKWYLEGRWVSSRRRRCLRCGARFTTHEKMAAGSLTPPIADTPPLSTPEGPCAAHSVAA